VGFKGEIMRGLIRTAVLIMAMAATCMISAMALTNSFLDVDIDDITFDFVMFTSSSYSPSPSNIMLFPAIWTDGHSTTRVIIKVDGSFYNIHDASLTKISSLFPTGNTVTGTKRTAGIDIICDWELVNNPATGVLPDTAKYKYTLKNSDSVPHYVALRLELDTMVITNDGANISVDNGFNIITSNTIYLKSLGQIKANWWDYDVAPTLGTPSLVGRGYTKNNAYGEPAVEPDIMEIAYWYNVNGNIQWNTAAPGAINNDSAVVLWWCNGDTTSNGFLLNPGQSITFLTYYGLNQEALLTTPTATKTISCTATYTPTFTITETFTYSPTSTQTCTFTSTYTITPTLTETLTHTPTPTITVTYTATPSFTSTPTFTTTPTYTMTATPTETSTKTSTPTITPSFTNTPTYTVTNTITDTSTITPTPTITPTFTPTPLPLILDLKGNFPNPFIKDTQIVYKLSVDADVKIRIFDVSGEIVRWQEDLAGKAGYNSFYWDGKNRAVKPVASGVFIYRIEASTSRGEHASGFMKAAVVK
jgi:hypothetical protein